MVIRMRHTRSHTKNRRSHHAIETSNLGTCAHCGKTKQMHTVCSHCGIYRGRVMIDVVKEAEKKQKKNS